MWQHACLTGLKIHSLTRQAELRVQDAYSLRCIPQIHGASFQVFNYVREKLEFEMNALMIILLSSMRMMKH